MGGSSIKKSKRKKAYLIYFGFSRREWAVILAALCIVIIFSAVLYGRLTSDARSSITIRELPGEFAEQQAIWLMWPSEIYNSGESPVNPVMLDLVRALAPRIKINIMVANSHQAGIVKNLMARYKFPEDGIRYYVVDHLSIWARDVGPVFVRDNNGRLCIVDFKFNNYGRYGDHYYVTTEGQVDVKAAEALQLPVVETKLVSEGGSFETNGQGTLLITEAVALKHNPGMTKAQIEDEYKRVLGVKKIIWLKQGLAEDRVTGGHVDEFVRFADANTILLGEVQPIDRRNSKLAEKSFRNLEENYQILLKEVDQDGKPFRIIRIPMPPGLYGSAGAANEIPVRSYLNYVVTNGAVVVQTYWRPDRPQILKTTEEEMVKTLKIMFPGREVIGINAEPVNTWGGGIHCVTQHMPAVTAE